MFIKFTFDVAVGSGLGVIVGAFIPSIGRRIKSLFVKETAALKADVSAEASKAASAVSSAAAGVVKKL